MKNYKELIIWRKGIDLVKQSYLLSDCLPKAEKYGLISRAAVSIPANIAEGSSRTSDKDYARFLKIVLGPAFEVQTYLVIIKEMNWANDEALLVFENSLEEEIKMIHGFLKRLVERAERFTES